MKQKFDISGMSCAACKAHVEKAVSSLDGIISCNVNLLSNSMDCEYENITTNDIIDAVVKAGYTAIVSTNIKEKSNKDYLSLKRRLIISIIFFIPLFYLSMGHMINLPIPDFLNSKVNIYNSLFHSLSLLVLCIPIMIVNKKYYKNGLTRLFKGGSNMDTLIAVGSISAFIYGIYIIIILIIGYINKNTKVFEIYHKEIYLESVGTILTLVTLGKFFEMKSKSKTTSAVDKLLQLAPDEVTVIKDDKEIITKINDVEIGDYIKVKPGDKLAFDGIIINGSSTIDESAMSGESIPVLKQKGDEVISGTTNLNSVFIYEVKTKFSDTTLSKIAKLVNDAANSKAPIAKLADKVSGIFVPVVLTIAVITFIVWIIASKNFSTSLSMAISVLVISCPCALGLATPVAIMVGTGTACENHILIKNAESLELLHKIDTVVLDKTGTITKGTPQVIDFENYSNLSDEEIKAIAYSLEKNSNHPLASAITTYCKTKELNVFEFQNYLGKGIFGIINNTKYYFGSIDFIFEKTNKTLDLNSYQVQAKTVMVLSNEEKILAIFAVRDEIKQSSPQAVELFQKHNINVIMLTGDKEITANAINKIVKADKVIANVMPKNKYDVVKNLQNQSKKVMMVGDGINDSIALTTADVGVAIGAGSDIAIDSADVILVKNDLIDVYNAHSLSKRVIRIIKQNLFWAFFYNAIGIPLAAGVFYPIFNIKLTPMIGAVAMSFSSVCVVLNALRIKKFKPYKEIIKMDNIIRVEEIMCEHCVKRVKNAMLEIDGITAVEIDLKKKKVSFTSDKEIPMEVLNKKLNKDGYTATEYKEKKGLFKRR